MLMGRMNSIVFASDLSKASGKAFAAAVAMAKANRATLTILHVVAPFMPVASEQYIRGETLEQINTEARRWSGRQVAKLAGKARKAGIRAVGLSAEGKPVHEILRAARSKRAGLIVVGTHGRTGLNRFFVGSVAERVVATAPCPVMIVRGR